MNLHFYEKVYLPIPKNLQDRAELVIIPTGSEAPYTAWYDKKQNLFLCNGKLGLKPSEIQFWALLPGKDHYSITEDESVKLTKKDIQNRLKAVENIRQMLDILAFLTDKGKAFQIEIASEKKKLKKLYDDTFKKWPDIHTEYEDLTGDWFSALSQANEDIECAEQYKLSFKRFLQVLKECKFNWEGVEIPSVEKEVST